MKILNFGSCNIDYVYSLDHIVNVGETLSSQNLNIFPGGKGLNQSVALSRAGAYVYHAGCVGSDGDILKLASAAAAPSIPSSQQVRDALKTMKVKAVDMAAKRILNKANDYIDNNICTVTLTELAKQLDYSPVYTATLIKKLTGKSYVDYLQSKRLELATRLLKTTEMPIKDIIQCCGYQNESYFRKIFKQQYNKTPLQYRRT